jgi:GNAT superfamily N-acetyltransferase
LTAPTIRRAEADDAVAVADLFLLCRHAAVPTIPPLAFPDEQVRDWLEGVVRQGREVWVAGCPAIVAFMLLVEGWIEQLYVDPSWTGRTIGSRLLEVAKGRSPEGLQLWAFQSNHRALSFYERHGFVAVERTDGTRNQERAPDVRYEWRPS